LLLPSGSNLSLESWTSFEREAASAVEIGSGNRAPGYEERVELEARRKMAREVVETG